ncbi:MAG: peptidase, partial [Planctomycetota bacterium]
MSSIPRRGRQMGTSHKRTGNSRKPDAVRKRTRLLETLESRQLLAGPQLIGIQPNQGELIEDGTVRDTAPRLLTFRFDEGQQIDPETFDAIQIVRAGGDGQFDPRGTVGTNDIDIVPALVTQGEGGPNEVVVRFADALPDDDYQIRINAFDDPAAGVVALRNTDGEVFVSRSENSRTQIVNFDLQLGALIEAVVPQPVIRQADGTLTQNRNEIVVYFNEDPLFVEDEFVAEVTAGSSRLRIEAAFPDGAFSDTNVIFASGSSASAEYVPATDQLLISVTPTTTLNEVVSEIRLIPRFKAEALQGGSAVFNPGSGVVATITARPTARSAENPRFYQLLLTQETVRTTDDARYEPVEVIYDPVTFTTRLFFADDINELGPDAEGNPGPGPEGGTFRLRIGTAVDDRVDLILPPTNVNVNSAVGDTFETAFGLGTFGSDTLTSLTISESIDSSASTVSLPVLGGEALSGGFLNGFVPDSVNGVVTVDYNFQGVFARSGSTAFLNQITEVQKTRIREVLGLYAEQLAVQFRETVDSGITFALGDPSVLPGGTNVGVLNASLRIDSTFTDPAIVFSNQADFELTYGSDFTRKAAAGVGLLLGLSTTPDLPSQTLLALDPAFINGTIDPANESQLRNLEPVFTSNFDVLQGQTLYRADSNDVDLYRFDVDLGDPDQVGNLSVQTFAERLEDASTLDTTLTLFAEQTATAETDFGFGRPLSVTFESTSDGKIGNDTEIRFVRSGRSPVDNVVRITQGIDAQNQPIPNVIVVDIPRVRTGVPGVSVQQIVDALNADAFASSLLIATVAGGDASQIAGDDFDTTTVELDGGGLVPLVRNDDYFSEDSSITATLGAGTYYIGVASTGNTGYDPTVANSGTGGRTQGEYELHVKFEPRVDEVDTIRDLDGSRVGVPSTVLDGDGDGVPGGAYNFWFQTRALNRRLTFTDSSNGIAQNET